MVKHSAIVTWPRAQVNPANNTLKSILYYTPFFTTPDYGFGIGKEPFFNCKVTTCQVTPQRDFFQDMGDFDAVIFHFPNLIMPGR